MKERSTRETHHSSLEDAFARSAGLNIVLLTIMSIVIILLVDRFNKMLA